jgi:hypothetical protein
MTEITLTQTEADFLFELPKQKVNNETWNFPPVGGKTTIPLVSVNKHEEFILDIYQGRIDLMKCMFQNRSRQIFVLARLDFSGPAHQNPDGEDIPTPHVHLYREGYGHKWAYPIPTDLFPHIENRIQTLYDFMEFCNIVDVPVIQDGLF